MTTQPPNVGRGIRLLRLRLRGIDRDYGVSFAGDDGLPRPLSVIAGEINTGKTSVLEFVDYCLGDSRHPSHQEVLSQVRSAQLEVLLDSTAYVIERAVGGPSTTATVRPGRLEEVGQTTGARRPIKPAGDPDSLSSWLLSYCGLEGIELREAPTQAESKTDPLSFRDLMWLAYLPNERLDNKNLLHESNYMQRLKLRQVVDIIFGVHDDAAVELGRRVSELDSRLSKARQELDALNRFMTEQEPRPPVELEMLVADVQARIELARVEVHQLDTQGHATTDFAEGLRRRHQQAAANARRAAGELRDRETLVARLMPLRAQYAEDIRKLTFLDEADRLFDPLRVTTCPACLTQLAETPELREGRCTLCDAAVTSDGDTSVDGVKPDLGIEIRSTRTRFNELNTYIDELEGELPALRAAAERSRVAEANAAATVDAAVASRGAVTPFLAQRDEIFARRQAAERDLEAARNALRMYASVEDRQRRVDMLARNLEVARAELAATQQTGRQRQEAVVALSRRFGVILSDFHYPKLDMPMLDDGLVPHVRGLRYVEASSGARTLIALAWQLSIFEQAVEANAAHPGFLMIDSPQKNLGSGTADEAEFQDARIVAGVYDHIHRWLDGPGRGAQVVIVDNAPPGAVEGDVIVRYSRDPEKPPYGLIENETG